jgi:hypothetical protein
MYHRRCGNPRRTGEIANSKRRTLNAEHRTSNEATLTSDKPLSH